jgi:hypothetical protein
MLCWKRTKYIFGFLKAINTITLYLEIKYLFDEFDKTPRWSFFWTMVIDLKMYTWYYDRHEENRC